VNRGSSNRLNPGILGLLTRLDDSTIVRFEISDSQDRGFEDRGFTISD